ncbi:hypothetical protein POVCU2_0020790 [Plasmodium ovale curtisi]|uniref:Uncharacterized protein n=1 Tax=Plasmodium ovale curtisi TaxID=864141 RepID=A0A1A8VSG7_PLAOA|nr:hypothetical protein POVCU2_0020790 [Plasmodium ovale curtisi]
MNVPTGRTASSIYALNLYKCPLSLLLPSHRLSKPPPHPSLMMKLQVQVTLGWGNWIEAADWRKQIETAD